MARSALVLLIAAVGIVQAAYICSSSYGEFWGDWCTSNCNHNPPFCPDGWCDCYEAGFPPEPWTGQPRSFVPQEGCCVDNAVVFFTSGSNDVYYVNVNPQTGIPGTPQLCFEFENALDLEVDTDGGLFVADYNEATVYYVTPGCGKKSAVFSWHENQISAPTSIAIGQYEGSYGLYVASSPHQLIFVALDEDEDNGYVYNSNIFIKNTNRVEDLELNPNDNTWWHVEGDKIYRNGTLWFDGNTQENRVPDIQDLVISATGCGLYFTSPDLNQVWHCPDMDDPDSCDRYCNKAGIDSDTCIDTWNPWGLAVDCQCNLYYSNKAGGKLNVFSMNNTVGDPWVVLNNLFLPQDVEIYIQEICFVPSPSQTPTISETPSVSPSFSPSASATASVTQPMTQTASASPTPSPSALPRYQLSLEDLEADCITCENPTGDVNLSFLISKPEYIDCNEAGTFCLASDMSADAGVQGLGGLGGLNWSGHLDFDIFIALSDYEANGYDPSIFPRIVSGPTLITDGWQLVVNCSGVPDGLDIVWSHLVGDPDGPCFDNDPRLVGGPYEGQQFCIPGNSQQTTLRVNVNNQTAPARYRRSQLDCQAGNKKKLTFKKDQVVMED